MVKAQICHKMRGSTNINNQNVVLLRMNLTTLDFMMKNNSNSGPWLQKNVEMVLAPEMVENP